MQCSNNYGYGTSRTTRVLVLQTKENQLQDQIIKRNTMSKYFVCHFFLRAFYLRCLVVGGDGSVCYLQTGERKKRSSSFSKRLSFIRSKERSGSEDALSGDERMLIKLIIVFLILSSVERVDCSDDCSLFWDCGVISRCCKSILLLNKELK